MAEIPSSGFDLDKITASVRRPFPDEIARLSERQRRERVGGFPPDVVTLNPMSPALRQKPRCFTRANLAIPLSLVTNVDLDELRLESWAEVNLDALISVVEDREQGIFEKPCRAKLATEVSGYPGTFGLQGEVRFRNSKEAPYFYLLGDHPLAVAQREGFDQDRLGVWLVSVGGVTAWS